MATEREVFPSRTAVFSDGCFRGAEVPRKRGFEGPNVLGFSEPVGVAGGVGTERDDVLTGWRSLRVTQMNYLRSQHFVKNLRRQCLSRDRTVVEKATSKRLERRERAALRGGDYFGRSIEHCMCMVRAHRVTPVQSTPEVLWKARRPRIAHRHAQVRGATCPV